MTFKIPLQVHVIWHPKDDRLCRPIARAPASGAYARFLSAAGAGNRYPGVLPLRRRQHR